VGQFPSCDRELGEQSVADWTLRQLAFPVAFYANSGAVGVQVATTLRPTDSKEICCFLRGACLVISGGEWHRPVVDDAFHHDGRGETVYAWQRG
jgi:hypothetical protein